MCEVDPAGLLGGPGVLAAGRGRAGEVDELEVDAVGEDDEGVCREAVGVCSTWADSAIGGKYTTLFTRQVRSVAYVKPSALKASTVSCRLPGGLRCTMWSRILVETSPVLDILYYDR